MPASDTGELDTALHLHTSGNTLKNFKFKVSLRLCWIGNFAHTSADDSACAKKKRTERLSFPKSTGSLVCVRHLIK